MEMLVNLKEKSYPIYIEQGLLHQVGEKIKAIYQGKKIAIITDDQVNHYYGEIVKSQLEKDYAVTIVEMPHGEKSKSFDVLPALYKQLLDFNLTRSDLIVALGGGVIGDLAGFVAATYLRGIPFVQIPTSLLAQVDSSVGGKVAVDLPAGKNLVGAFHHPKMVLIDPLVLKTLEPRFIHDGMGEVIKYGCIKDVSLFKQLAAYKDFGDLYKDIDEIIYRCVDIKRRVVENDEKDFGDRLVLNFGHTLAHTIEQYYHYEKYSHGEAVAIGMYQLTKIAEERGLTPKNTAEKIKAVLERYELPTACKEEMVVLKNTIKLDKKNINSKLSLILLKNLGEAFVHPTDLTFFDGVERV
ncbi:MAG: 3-dehydroquinate synthase [Beduini sp.]|uniref:3-dehydroquinate synthase n=1 Tax=Beduini sp. TaxID=1922300 RepID=UPI00399F6BE8